jgi:hypothetical protein
MGNLSATVGVVFMSGKVFFYGANPGGNELLTMDLFL